MIGDSSERLSPFSLMISLKSSSSMVGSMDLTKILTFSFSGFVHWRTWISLSGLGVRNDQSALSNDWFSAAVSTPIHRNGSLPFEIEVDFGVTPVFSWILFALLYRETGRASSGFSIFMIATAKSGLFVGREDLGSGLLADLERFVCCVT